MYFNVIFPMQLSEFMRAVNFGSNMKPNLKIDFYR